MIFELGWNYDNPKHKDTLLIEFGAIFNVKNNRYIIEINSPEDLKVLYDKINKIMGISKWEYDLLLNFDPAAIYIHNNNQI